MTIYHNQCCKCYCSTYYKEVDDGLDDEKNGFGDCGCDDQDEEDDSDGDD